MLTGADFLDPHAHGAVLPALSLLYPLFSTLMRIDSMCSTKILHRTLTTKGTKEEHLLG
jgi:hypothetical protein